MRPARGHGQGEDRRRGLAAPADRAVRRRARSRSCGSRSASRRRSTASSTAWASGSSTCRTASSSTPTTARRPRSRPTSGASCPETVLVRRIVARGRVPAAHRPDPGGLMAVAEAPLRTPRRDRSPSAARRAQARAPSYEHQWLLYLRTWRGSIFGNFAQPVLFLVAMGVGPRGLRRRGPARRRWAACPYLQFLAPALLVATVMQGSVFEATFPILAGFHWIRRFHAMYATPISPSTSPSGSSPGSRPGRRWSGAIFVRRDRPVRGGRDARDRAGGAGRDPDRARVRGADRGVHVHPARHDAFNAIWRFGITPLFLFSGTFFPIDAAAGAAPADRLAAAAVARRGPGPRAGARDRRWTTRC